MYFHTLLAIVSCLMIDNSFFECENDYFCLVPTYKGQGKSGLFPPSIQRKSGNCFLSNAYAPCMCMAISSKESLIMCFYGKAAFRHHS